MTTGRDAFLQRVRQAVSEGNRSGSAAGLPTRGDIGYQGAGPDLVAGFQAALAAAGGQMHLVPDGEAAARRVLELVQGMAARRALIGRGPVVDSLRMPERLRDANVETVLVDTLSPSTGRDPFFAADVGISGVDYVIAETGTVVLGCRPEEPRSLSLLPPIHIAVAQRRQLLPDLFDLFRAFSTPDGRESVDLPSCLSLITGPSKTGDIELRLVTGVHGPGEVHVVLIDS
jgi:L-lactate utilization protein LutC